MLAADLYVDDAYVVTTNNVGGPGPDPGDIVTYGAGQAWQKTGLIFGTNAFNNIQAAVDAAAWGNIIAVAEGTYVGDVVINQSVALRADGAVANTVIQGVAGGHPAAVHIATSTVTLGGAGDGFTIMTPDKGVYLVEGLNNVVIQGNVIHAGPGNNAIESGRDVHHISIDSNTFTGSASQLVYINGQASHPGFPSSNVDITNNIFSGSAPTGPLLGLESTGGDITGNQFTGATGYTALELWGGGNNVSGNTFAATGGGSQIIDQLSLYNATTLLSNNTFSGGTIISGNKLAVAGSAGNDELTIIASGANSGNYQLTLGGVAGAVIPFSGLTTLTFHGQAGNDLLRIQQSAGSELNIPVFYDGGTSAGDNDELAIVGGSYAQITKNFTNATSGTVVLDPTGPAGASTITYTGLEPVLINVGTVADMIFNLPAGADTAILEDDAGAVANRSQIRSVGGTFETTEFTHPTGSLAVNGGAGDVVQIAFTETLGAANFAVSGVSGIQAGLVSTTGNVTLSTTGAISDLTSDAATDITANILSMTAATGIDVDVSVANLSATNSSSGSVTITEANAVTLTNVTNNNGPINFNTTGAGNIVAENVNAGSGNINITVANGNLTSGGADADVADIVGNIVTLVLSTASRNFGSALQRLELDAIRLTTTTPSGSNLAYIVDTAGGLTMHDSSIGANDNTVFDLLVLNGNLLTSGATPSGTRDLGATEIRLKVTGATSTIGTPGTLFKVNAPISNVNSVVFAESDGGGIYIRDTADNFPVGVVNAGAGNVSLTSSTGSIIDRNAGALNVTGSVLTFNAINGIDLDVNGTSMSATVSGTGAITVDDLAGGLAVTSATTNSGSITVNTINGGLVVTSATTTSGSINLNAIDGDLALTIVTAGGAGNINASTTTSGDILVGNVSAVGDTITLNAAEAIEETGADLDSDITADTINLTAVSGIGALGQIEINAGFAVGGLSASVSSAGPINLRDLDSLLVNTATTADGNITLEAANGSLTLTTVTAGSGGDVVARTLAGSGVLSVGSINAAGDDVSLSAFGGMTDGNGVAVNIVASRAELVATSGIGHGNEIEMQVSTLAARNILTNDIILANQLATTLTLGTVNATSGIRNLAPGGNVVLTTPRGIDVTQTSSAGGSLRFTGGESSASNAENLNVSPGVSITASGGDLTLEVGDNFSFPATTVLAAPGNDIFINSLDTATDAEGSVFDSFGDLNATNAKFTGGNQSDIFNITVDSNTHIDVEGNDPDVPVLPGDILNIFGASLTLTVTGVGTGTWSSGAIAGLDYIEIETVNASGPYHLVVDMGAAGLLPSNSVDAQLDGTNTELEIRVDTDDDARNGVLAFNGDVTDIRSLAVLGSGSGEVFSITQNANDLLPGQSGGLNNSSPLANPLNASFLFAGRTPNSPNPPAFHFTGNGGDDELRFNLNLAENVGYFADGSGSGDVNIQGKLTASFTSNERFDVNQLVTGGSIVIDSSSYASLSNMMITDIGSATEVVGDAGFATAEFRNAASVTIRSGLGQDTIDLISIDPAGLVSVTLDGDSVQNSDIPAGPLYINANDTLRLRSLPAGVTALLLGGLGSDTFQLYDASNTVDNILGVVTIQGEDGHAADSSVTNNQDRLFVIDSGDGTGDIVLITDNSIAGLTGFGAGQGVLFSGIDLLDVTTTAGEDLITIDMDNVPAPTDAFDLNVAHVRGNDGQDTFLINGVENLTDLFLYGDGPDDQAAGDLFGTTAQRIRPSLETVIHIDGGPPSPVAPAGNIAGDRLNLDMAVGGTPLSPVIANATTPVIVDTVNGYASSASHQNILFGDLEWFDVIDKHGQTNVERGDLYVRASEGADRITLYPHTTYKTDGRVRLRYNRTDLGPIETTNASITTVGLWIVYGRDGNDQITVNNTLVRDTELYGQVGNDYLVGSANGGSDLLVGGSGNDRLQGLAGDDILWGDKSPLPVDILDLGPDGKDRLNGGKGNDLLIAAGNNDYAYGEDGDDVVFGGDGDDRVGGDRGNDIVVGGDGKDRVNGGFGRDLVFGGLGIDTVDGDHDDDIVIGDASIWDDYSPANVVALQGILFGPNGTGEFWDSASDYDTRTAALLSLFNGNITEDNAKDTLIGDGGLDWFWDININDKYSRKLASERIN